VKTFNNFGLTVVIDPIKAEALTRAAEKVDHKGFMRCVFPSHEGDKQLVALVDQYRDRFQPESIAVINKWLANHKGHIFDRSRRLEMPK
jgi:hypothetical protein